MKKFICTGDIHLWLRRDVPEEWQINRYRLLCQELISLCRQHDAALIIAGDFFEKSDPTQEEVHEGLVFLRTLRQADITVWLITGNHETIANNEDTFCYLDAGHGKTIDINYSRDGLSYINYPDDTQLHLVNHCNLKGYPRMTLEELNGEYEVGVKHHILVTHFRCNYNMFVKEELNVAELIAPYDLCIAGDIHDSYQDGKLIYTNTPLNKEFLKEESVNNGVLLLTIDKGTHTVSRIPVSLPSLIQVTVGAGDKMPHFNKTDFYRVEVTGNLTALRELTLPVDNAKLIKVPEDSEVLLTSSEDEVEYQSREEEYSAYLAELDYSPDHIDRMMLVFRGGVT